MPTGILASLAVEIGAEISGFQRGVATAKKELAGLVKAGQAMQSIGQTLSTYVTAPLVLAGGAAIKVAGDMQALQKGFAATYKGAEPLNVALAKVAELAKLPGLGLKEALQGATNLQAAGFSADLATRALGAFGNALATVGKGKADLDGVGLALSQIASKGKISAEEINQLAERVPQIRQAMQAAFGTADTQVLQKLKISATDFVEGVTAELGKLPKVTGGINNAFENLQDAGTTALAKLGDSINKNFDVEGTLGKLGDYLTEIGDRFAALDPGTQKFILTLAGLAAAAGPVLLALGGLATALPFIEAGLVALTGPIGITVAVVAALGLGIAALATSGKDATGEFNKQRESVTSLERSVSPLLSRYDELKGKSALTKAEQEELRKIIEQVGKQIPSAITAFDEYGRAMDINTGKARDFTKAQQEILAVKNRDALTEQRAEYARLTQEIDAATAALQRRNAAGDIVQVQRVADPTSTRDFATRLEEVRLTGDEIAALQARLEGFRTARRGVGGLIDELKGIRPAVQDAAEAGEKVAALPKKMADALKKLQEALALNANLSTALGTDYDYLKGKHSALEAGIKSLVSAGFDPAGKTVQRYVAQLRELNTVLGDNTQLQLRQAENLKKLTETPDFKLQAPKLPPLPEKLKTAAIDTSATKESLTEFEAFVGRFRAGAEEAVEGIGGTIGASLAGIAQEVGAALANGESAMTAFGEGLLKAFGNIIVEFGAKLILLGVGNIAAQNYAVGAAQLAAGALLSAGGAYVIGSLNSRSATPGGSGSTSPVRAGASGAVPEQRIKIELAPVVFRQKGPDLDAVASVNKYRQLRLS